MSPFAAAVLVGAAGSTEAVDKVVESTSPGPEDADWIALYKRLYLPMVRLAGLLVGDYRVGEDIAQDAFARLVEAGTAVATPAAYLRATVVNLSRSQIRRAVLSRRHPLPQSGIVAGPEEGTNQMEAQTAVRHALMRLSRRQREAVVLRYFAELSDAETAATMGVSVGSVKTHLHRARTALSIDLAALR